MGECAKKNPRAQIVDIDVSIAAANVAAYGIVGHGEAGHFARVSLEIVHVASGDKRFHLNGRVVARCDDEQIIGGDDHSCDRRARRIDDIDQLHVAKCPSSDHSIT